MNVEIGAEAALFPEKEYINGIAVAVWSTKTLDAVAALPHQVQAQKLLNEFHDTAAARPSHPQTTTQSRAPHQNR